MEGLARAERLVQFAARVLVEVVQVERAVTLVAQDLDKGWPALFLRRLQLTVGNAQELHLQRLGEKILGIPAIRTRERQNRLHLGRSTVLPGQSLSQPIHGRREKNRHFRRK